MNLPRVSVAGLLITILIITWSIFGFFSGNMSDSVTFAGDLPTAESADILGDEGIPDDFRYLIYLPLLLGSTADNPDIPIEIPEEPEEPEEPEVPEEPEEPEEPGENEQPGPEEVQEYNTGFEVDGNTALDQGGDYDRETVPGGQLLHLEDPHSKGAKDPTVFKPNGKFDQPERWRISAGSVGPPQTELTNLMAWLVSKDELGPGKPSSPWLILAMERSKKEGSFYLDFEINQLPWDGQRGGPERSPGDLSIGFAIHGNPAEVDEDLTIFIIQYLPGAQPNSCSVGAGPGGKPDSIQPGDNPCPPFGELGWFYRFLGTSTALETSGLGQATMNEQTIPAVWPSYDSHGDPREEIGPFQFAEAAINLEFLDLEPGCSAWSSIHAKGRSSLEPKSDLKDLAGPIEIGNNCRLAGHKYLDINGDGLWDEDEPPLAGWQITLAGDQVARTDGQGAYAFEDLNDGLYPVQESCPAGWVQTAPEATDFAGCGSEIFNVDINGNNQVVTGLDFGNGRPDLAVRQSCSGDVFLGDDIQYTVQLTNQGNVDLVNVRIDEPEAESLAALERLGPGQSASLTYSVKATTPGEVSKAVKGQAEYALATINETATASCKTSVHVLEVNNEAQVSVERLLKWQITKEVDDPGPIVILRGRALKPTYTVTVSSANPAYIDGDTWISGAISVKNPAPIAATLAGVTDILEPDLTIPVSCPALLVPAGGTILCTYGPQKVAAVNSRLNTATARLINNNNEFTDFSDTVTVDFSQPQAKLIDEVVDVFDSQLGYLGSAHYSDSPRVFTYDQIIGPYDICGDVSIDNVATFATRDTATSGRATATVDVFVLCTVRIGFEDLPLGGGNDWDYNDLVVDVGIRVSLSGDPVHPNLEAVHLSITRLVGGPETSIKEHELHLAPDVFSCDGSYQLRFYQKNGSFVQEQGDYYKGLDFLVFSEQQPLPAWVELSIFFDVPPEGCPCNKDVLGDPFNTFHGEALFFRPWMKAYRDGSSVTVEPADPRMLVVPDMWQWPPEQQHIWVSYPKVTAGNPPIFVPFWWLP